MGTKWFYDWAFNYHPGRSAEGSSDCDAYQCIPLISADSDLVSKFPKTDIL